MLLSKQLRLILSFVVIAVASGCTKPDSKPDGVNGKDALNNATFWVTTARGDGILEYAPPEMISTMDGAKRISQWRIPRQASYTFTACMMDRATRNQAAGHRFDVEVPGRGLRIDRKDVTETQPNGCFTWIETFDFNFFVKRGRWIVVERDIVGTGIHTGRQRIQFAINPWGLGNGAREAEGRRARFLRDEPLRKDQLVEASHGIAALGGIPGSATGEDQLFIDSVDIQPVRRGERSTGMFLRLNLSMEPKVRFENFEGVPQFRKLESGEFWVLAHLVLNNSGRGMRERVILTSGADVPKELASKGFSGVVGQGRVIDGKLIARVDAWIDPRLPQGNLELVLKVIPKGIRGIREFDGIYDLGAFNNLSSNRSGYLNEECRDNDDKPCNIAQYLAGATNFDELKRAGQAMSNSPYLFDRLKLRFVQVEPGETTTQRTVAYAASTCVTDAFTGDRPVGLPFIVRYKDTGEVIPVKTEEDGCLYWSSSIFHKYYYPEEFIEHNISIEKDTGVATHLRFYLNPWDDKFTFGFDEREFKAEFWQVLKKRKKIRSRFFMADFGYHTVRFQYNIDNLMNLEVRKTVLMELEPRVLRYSGIINARKMTEPLRDGIWLMKVAIQKNYLDPAQLGVGIEALRSTQAMSRINQPQQGQAGTMVRLANETQEAQTRNTLHRLRKLGIRAPVKEYISTQTALVRSTDGVIIQPVELSMQDLRLMRVRANFLVQLEAVDERKLQAENTLRRWFGSEVDKSLTDVASQREQLRRGLQDMQRLKDEFKKPELSVDDDARIKQKQEEIETFLNRRRLLVNRVFSDINRSLDASRRLELNLDNYQLSPEEMESLKPQLASLDVELETNDFTNIKLPPCTEVDCNMFLEKDSGLDRRSFVGPVIFLSNAYKDSVRATDNLDEARCGMKIDFDDPFEQRLRAMELSLFFGQDNRGRPINPLAELKAEELSQWQKKDQEAYEKHRQNTMYRFSEFFGSLRHLCYKQVDDLIAKEAEDRYVYTRNQPAISSVHNFASSFNLDFLSLSDEKPKRVNMDEATLLACKGDLVSCMRETDEFRMPLNKALERVEAQAASLGNFVTRAWNSYWGNDTAKTSGWMKEDLDKAFFNGPFNFYGAQWDTASSRTAACALLAGQMADDMRSRNVRLLGQSHPQVESQIFRFCVNNYMNPIHFDRKLRVFQTGQTGDAYVFMGGYQLNINVGQSFSVSRSDSLSWGWGLEAQDFVGWIPVIGKWASGATKPGSLKVGGSQSLSNSNGTSISDSTYLVSQIAKFQVRLDEYERCIVMKFRPEFMASLSTRMGPLIERHPGRGLLVCEGEGGRKRNQPQAVEEMYFYFTQHFTEGDMLDQADLYNHPWLLGLRGLRDFGQFMSKIRNQEGVTMGNFIRGVFKPEPRQLDWPLEHMLQTYKRITPSFPGFYTILGEEEQLAQFPLEGRLSKTDPDANNEVTSRQWKEREMRRQ